MIDLIKMKLDGFPHIYYINLDHRVDRNDYMKQVSDTYQLPMTRIPATYTNVPFPLHDGIPNDLRPNEIACTISHLRAIHYWLTHSDTDTAIICEDDISFETVPDIPFSWNELVSQLPYYWEIVQLSIIYHPKFPIAVNLHHRNTTDFSAACYLIKRDYAERLMKYHFFHGKWKLDYPIKTRMTSEDLLYNAGITISIPLFTYHSFLSDIQTPDHVEYYHVFSRNLILTLWKSPHLPNLLDMKNNLFLT